MRTIVEEVTYEDGVEVERVEISREVTTQPVNEIIEYGTMEPRVEELKVSPLTKVLEVDETFKITATTTPTGVPAVIDWTTENEDLIDLTFTGKTATVVALAPGEATVVARVSGENDLVAQTVITITEPEPEIRVEEETVKEDIVPYSTIRNDTDSLPLGTEQVVQEGVDGYTNVTYEVTYEDDVEVSREEKSRDVVAPIDEIIEVGTYEEPDPEPDPEPEPGDGED